MIIASLRGKLYGYTRSWIPIHQVIGSQVMPDRRSTNFVKSTVFFYLARLLLLCRVLYTINFTILSLPVFLMVSLEKKYCYFYLRLIPTSSLEGNLFYHILTGKKKKKKKKKNVSSVFYPESSQ